jgi:hypothetical protein
MEWFEKEALQRTSFKPAIWWRYVDATFVVWPHGREKLNDFLLLLNTIHPSIEFTMEIEKDRSLPFLDVLVTRKPDGSLGHEVYRKPTHTDRYTFTPSHITIPVKRLAYFER